MTLYTLKAMIGAKGKILTTSILSLLLAAFAFAQDPAQITPYQLLDARSGIAIPCVGCSIFTYAAGTNTPLVTYTDYTLGTPNTNPVLTNSAGYAVNVSTITGIWVGASCYKFVAKDAASATIWTQDHICDQAQVLKALLASSAGAGIVGFSQSSSYSAGTVGRALQDTVSITDAPYSAVCDGGSTDNTSKIQAALATGKSIFVPGCDSYYGITSPVALTAVGQSVYGVGHLSKIVQSGTNANSTVFSVASLGYNEFRGLYLLPSSTVTGPGSTVYGYGIKVYLSDHVNINHVEVSGSRRGGFIIQDSNYANVSDNDIHNSAVDSSTDSASEAGNDVYFYGSSSYGVVSRNHMTSGSGIAIAFQTSAITDVMCYNKAAENVINGEGMYGIIFYNTNASNLCSGGSAVANTVNNITGAIVAVGGDPTSKYFGAAIYVASAEKVLVDANICDRYNVSTNNRQQAPGCPGISGASDVTVTNNKGYNSGQYGASAFRAEADTNPSGKHIWIGNSYINAAAQGFIANDIPNLDFSHNHIWGNANSADAIDDFANLHHDQAIYHLLSFNDITGYGSGIQQIGKVKEVQAISNRVTGNTGWAVLIDGVKSEIAGSIVTQGTGAFGLGFYSHVVSGQASMHDNTISGSTSTYCVNNDAPLVFALYNNNVFDCGGQFFSNNRGPWLIMDAGATPAIYNGTLFRKEETSTITNLTNWPQGADIYITAAGVSFLVTNNANILLAGNINFPMQANDVLHLKCETSSCYEVGRSVNH